MERKELLYEGKAKQVFRTDDPGTYWIRYKDDATAFDGKKRGSIEGKGFYNNQISAMLFRFLETQGLDTHMVALLEDREMLVRALDIIPVEVIVRNVAAGSLARRLGLEEGTVLDRPVLEFCYKSDELGDPMINEYHIAAMGWASEPEMDSIRKQALEINRLLVPYFRKRDMTLVDFKLEFGRFEGRVILGDEISPDTCRLWDVTTGEKMDKDRFRRDLGKVGEAYREVYRRLKESGEQQ